MSDRADDTGPDATSSAQAEPVTAAAPAVAKPRASPRPKVALNAPSRSPVARPHPIARKVHASARRHFVRRAARRAKGPRIYVVRRGDNLWEIAERYYARGRRYKFVYRANRRKIANANRIFPGQRLRVPR